MDLKYCLLWVTVLIAIGVKAQVYPGHDFQSPLDTPLYLSAPFGSLRDNHFHSGMDIRTYEREGLPVYAVADGYIVRIKYSPYGYGKALYINHPNGYTSVYGHLQNAYGPVAEYIKKYQYEISSFDFDHFPGRDRIKVKKGDTIGWSGNSGGSTGPHLHFEIRNTKTEEIINPQLFGIPVVDEEAPAIQQLFVYTFDEQGSNQLKRYPINDKNSIDTDSGKVMIDTILLPGQAVGFAVDATDYLLGRNKEYSLYGLDLQIDNKIYYQFRMDRFAFSDSRSVNRHIDYAYYKKEGNRIQKLFVDDGNSAKLYSFLRNKGKYVPGDTMIHLLQCKASDFQMRSATVYAFIRVAGVPVNKDLQHNVVATCYPSRPAVFQNTLVRLEVPPKAVYDTLNLEYELLPKENGMLSQTHRVHTIYRPLQRNISISLKPDETLQKEKLLLAYSTNGKYWRSAGGAFENGFVTTRSNVFGMYAVTIDTIAPVIKALFNNRSAVDTVSLRFKVTDNFSGIDSYILNINGKWALAEYDAKNDMLEYFFDENTPETKLDIELIVSDKKGNQSVFKTTYWRTHME